MARGALLAAFALAVSCSLVVPSELDEIRCTQEGEIGPPACDPGYVCAGHVCTLCQANEICGDGFDNDCLGGVDNGCAATGGSGGGLPDGAGGSSGLPDGSAATGGVSGVGGVAGSSGVGGAVGGSGGNGGSPVVGSPCGVDEDCDPAHFCAPEPPILGINSGAMCTRGCCSSSDCGTGNVCFVTPRGNNVCAPGPTVNRPVLGTKSAGSACGAPGECRSGLCEGGYCVDACCSNVDCGGQLPHCTLRSIGGATKMAFHCGQTGDSSFNQFCLGSDECQSNWCVGTEFTCSTRCCKKSDCAPAGSDWTCAYVNQPNYAVPVCLPVSATGSKAIGEPCGAPAECQSGKCLTLSGLGNVCTDACCRDEDCGDTAQFGCRALNAAGNGLLLCVPL